MVKNCKYCGAEMDENAVKCPECGKDVPNAEIILDKQRQSKKKKNAIIITIIVCVILVIAILVISIVGGKKKTGANSYIDALDMNLSAMFNNDPNKYLKSYPDFMRDMLEETLGSMTDGNFNEYIALLNDEIVKVYGSDATVSYNILNKGHLEDDAAQEYLESIFEYIDDYSIEDFPIEDAYQLNLEIDVTGSVGTQTFYTTVATMQFDGSWYVLNIINPINQQVDNQQG